MLRTTSRRSAPSKFSTTPPPVGSDRLARRQSAAGLLAFHEDAGALEDARLVLRSRQARRQRPLRGIGQRGRYGRPWTRVAWRAFDVAPDASGRAPASRRPQERGGARKRAPAGRIGRSALLLSGRRAVARGRRPREAAHSSKGSEFARAHRGAFGVRCCWYDLYSSAHRRVGAGVGAWRGRRGASCRAAGRQRVQGCRRGRRLPLGRGCAARAARRRSASDASAAKALPRPRRRPRLARRAARGAGGRAPVQGPQAAPSGAGLVATRSTSSSDSSPSGELDAVGLHFGHQHAVDRVALLDAARLAARGLAQERRALAVDHRGAGQRELAALHPRLRTVHRRRRAPAGGSG